MCNTFMVIVSSAGSLCRLTVLTDLHCERAEKRMRALEGWEPTDVSASMSAEDGILRGTWSVEASWLSQFDEGDLSEVAFSEHVIETIKG